MQAKKRLKSWFIKQMAIMNQYNEVIELLHSYRISSDKEEVSLYEDYVYMEDEDWEDVKREALS